MYQKILVPVDGSETAARGLQEALSLARALKSSLHLLNVIDEYPLMVEMSSVVNAEDLRQSMRQYAQGVLAKARQKADEANRTKSRWPGCVGDPVEGARTGLRPDRDGHARPPRAEPHVAGQRC